MTASAVLFSGGLDSAVLLADEARRGLVYPLYVSVGLAWEPAERARAARLLEAPVFEGVQPLVRLESTVRDVYATSHWALRGQPPAYDTPDEDVYLVGRNVMLLAKAGIYCAQHGVGRITLGPLARNPFPDARRDRSSVTSPRARDGSRTRSGASCSAKLAARCTKCRRTSSPRRSWTSSRRASPST